MPESRSPSDDLLSIVRMLPDVVFRAEKRMDGKIYWTLNEGRLAEEFHLTTDEIRDRPLEELFPPPAAAKLQAEFDRSFRGETHEFVNEIAGRFFRHYPQPVFGPDGRVRSVVGFITEVTGLVKAQQRIEELQSVGRTLNDQLTSRVLELAQANRELETFSYTVSHDLRTPLTIIENYAHVLRGRHVEDLDDQARQCLDGLQRAVRRMSLLIENILKMSRVTRGELNPGPIDLAQMTQEIVRELRERFPERQVEVRAPPTLAAEGDYNIVRIALANLVGNAWKFTQKTPHPWIQVGVRREGGQDAYFVRDNGAGFEPADASRLFRLFERLHPAQEFEGSGIGLVTVERAIQRHGGRVWAEGRPQQGATFFFTLGGAAEPASTEGKA